MRTVALEEAGEGFERLLVDAGEDVFVITRGGQPIAEVRPIASTGGKPDRVGKRFGFSTQTIVMSEDFDRYGEKEIEAMFYGDE